MFLGLARHARPGEAMTQHGLIAVWETFTTCDQAYARILEFYVYHTACHACGFEPSWLDGRGAPTTQAMRASILTYNGTARH